jgi:DNA polymerase (family 10)
MDNRSIAQLLGETADLLEIAAGDPFRIRSYRRAAEAVENSTEQLSSFVNEPERLLAIQGIGKGMAANIQEIETRGSLKLRDELLTKYRSTMLELLKLPGMGPKTVALLWEALQVSDVEQLQAAIDAGKLANLPRFGQKLIDKLSRGITEYFCSTTLAPQRNESRSTWNSSRASTKSYRRARYAADGRPLAIWICW